MIVHPEGGGPSVAANASAKLGEISAPVGPGDHHGTELLWLLDLHNRCSGAKVAITHTAFPLTYTAHTTTS